jgi:hypothetical protein
MNDPRIGGQRTDEVTLAAIDRLNAEKRTWSFEVVNHLVLEEEVVVLGRLVLDGVTKMTFGTTVVSRDVSGKPTSIGGDLKIAANDALSRAVRLFGAGLVFREPEAAARVDESARHSPAPENRVTQRQLGALQGLARRRNMGRGQLGELLHQRFGTRELVSLTKKEASELLSELTGASAHASP